MPTAVNQNAPAQTPRKRDELRKLGIGSERASDAERIAAHPEVMERVIAESEQS